MKGSATIIGNITGNAVARGVIIGNAIGGKGIDGSGSRSRE